MYLSLGVVFGRLHESISTPPSMYSRSTAPYSPQPPLLHKFTIRRAIHINVDMASHTLASKARPALSIPIPRFVIPSSLSHSPTAHQHYSTAAAAVGSAITRARANATNPSRRTLPRRQQQRWWCQDRQQRQQQQQQQQRWFSSTPPRRLRTTEMGDAELAGLKVDGARLMEELHHTCGWGQGRRWGRLVPFFFSFCSSLCLWSLGERFKLSLRGVKFDGFVVSKYSVEWSLGGVIWMGCVFCLCSMCWFWSFDQVVFEGS